MDIHNGDWLCHRYSCLSLVHIGRFFTTLEGFRPTRIIDWRPNHQLSCNTRRKMAGPRWNRREHRSQRFQGQRSYAALQQGARCQPADRGACRFVCGAEVGWGLVTDKALHFLSSDGHRCQGMSRPCINRFTFYRSNTTLQCLASYCRDRSRCI